jgi:prepilin-type N-terminal cleavage/methylation domain-containing protein
MEYKKVRGFTLVELIVVITILAILGTISFFSVQSYTESARNSIRIDAISKIATNIDTKSLA